MTRINPSLTTPAINPTISIPYAQYLNLFLHPPLTHPKHNTFEEFARQEARYSLQTAKAIYSASATSLNTTSLIAALQPIKTGTLVLITGSATPNSTNPPPRITIGACIPTPWDIERQRSFRASPPQKVHCYTPDHMLFQLEPCQEILHPEPNAWIMDLAQITDSELKFGAEEASGLRVDFTRGVATLKSVGSEQDSADLLTQSPDPSSLSSTYHTLEPSANSINPSHTQSWFSSLVIDKFEVYDLGGHATLPFEEQLYPKPLLRTLTPEPQSTPVIKSEAPPETEKSMPRVDGWELKGRIIGFGSSGRQGGGMGQKIVL